MKRLYIFSIIFLFFLANASAQTISKAPVNPDFIKFRDKKITIQAAPGRAPDLAVPSRALGYFPSPVDLSHLTMPVIKKRDDRYTPDGYAAIYDLRNETDKLSSVKDQGSTCGACWTFAAYGAMESMLLTTETW
ncbi:MAG: hypothetical protein KAI33_01840, partial [Elusimicrobiales bacterium]|nr:hypothetical protein [Elusimicrobiales bacterium]